MLTLFLFYFFPSSCDQDDDDDDKKKLKESEEWFEPKMEKWEEQASKRIIKFTLASREWAEMNIITSTQEYARMEEGESYKVFPNV